MFSASSLKFLLLAALALPVIASGQTAAAPNETVAPIDRQALVTRHNITWNDAAGRIALGNGEFCFGTDGTGLQTFAGNSIAHWGWHSFPLPDGCTPDLVPATGAFEHRTTDGKMKGAINTWMFDNPHMMNLGRLRLMRAGGRSLAPGDITGLHRTLDLWTGVQTSSYQIDGRNVTVETCVHPKLDMVAVRIVSPLVESGELEVALDFGYPTVNNAAWVGDFNRSEGHSTEVISSSPGRMDYKRTVDATGYRVALEVADGGVIRMPVTVRGGQKLAIRKAEYGTGDQWAEVTTKISAAVKNDKIAQAVDFTAMGVDPAPGKAKRLRVTYALDGLETNAEIPDNQIFHIPADDCANAYLVSARGHKTLAFTCAFSPEPLPSRLPLFEQTRDVCAARWQSFWQHGGAIDLSGSKDPRGKELERRIVLSQYQMAAQSAGTWPPAETGLLGLDNWRGQFHMEMVWWHLAHYALWDRWEMADKALDCYQRFIPTARELAAQLGYKGLKWGKECGPEGRSAPWAGNHALLWKQPHPIFFAELEYRLKPTRATLDKWAGIVNGTAEHMADYPKRDATTGIYSLDPAMPPSEQGFTKNDVFDLAYWRWALDKAQQWRERMGLPREPHWDEVRTNLTPLPVADGLFVHSTEWADTYTKRNFEHPDPIGVLGMLPPIQGVDAGIATRTVAKVWTTWQWDRCWGWDFPWMAMAAARTGQPQIAVDALLAKSPRNGYDLQGINTGGPCPYLPGNGGLLYAAAMMAAGWDGAPQRHAPGFPADGSWVVKWEGLKTAP